MTSPREDLARQVALFRDWAEALARSAGRPVDELRGEWACDYKDWQALYRAVFDVLDAVPIADWDGPTTEFLLYALARDDEDERIAEELSTRPEALLAITRAALRSPERNARWQVAAHLSRVSDPPIEARSLLESLAGDGDEYVRRRALMSLGILGSPALEGLIDRAWASGHEYQRMASPAALRDSHSPRLDEFLALAGLDGRPYLVAQAARIRAGDR